MASVSFLNVDKIYPGGTKAVNGFSLDIDDKEFMVIMGPSGCGKSTLLKLIAGLEKPTSGRIFIGGEDVTDLPPGKRGVAVVMQTNSLFPHMSVFDNLSFGLTVLKTNKETIRQKVLAAAEALNISDLLDRKPSSLSGGQKQRVALGRALAVNPRVFLLDEPLSSLDTSLKSSMRAEIKRLHQAVGTTFVYVTHDQTEAMSLGGRIAVVKDGVLSQAGTPREIYDNPANKFAAQFIGSPGMNLFDAKIVKETSSDNLSVCFCGKKLQIKPDFFTNLISNPILEPEKEYEILMGIRPEDVRLTDKSGVCVLTKKDAKNKDNNGNITGKNSYSDAYYLIDVQIIMIEPAGGENIIHAALDKNCNIVLKCAGDRSLSVGDMIDVEINTSKLKFFDKESGKRIM